MSRPMLLVFVFIILIITSQFEWRQQLSDIDANPTESQKQQQISNREEGVKEKIILAQERKINNLNELVQSIKEQLQRCQSINGRTNLSSSTTENVIEELERQHIMDD